MFHGRGEGREHGGGDEPGCGQQDVAELVDDRPRRDQPGERVARVAGSAGRVHDDRVAFT